MFCWGIGTVYRNTWGDYPKAFGDVPLSFFHFSEFRRKRFRFEGLVSLAEKLSRGPPK